MSFDRDDEVWNVVKKFEACAYTLSEFDHGRHLAVGLAYLSSGSFEAAMARMRESLVRFSTHHGKMGYHETITRFWLLKLDAMRDGKPLWQVANEAAARLGNKDLIFDHYEREVLLSAEAREGWVEPTKAIFDRPDRVR